MERQSNYSLVAILFLLLTPLLSYAQEGYAENTEMADILYQNGKIYLVVFVMATIFAGIIIYLISIERKLNKLEKNNN
jgi:hypothetical protein